MTDPMQAMLANMAAKSEPKPIAPKPIELVETKSIQVDKEPIELTPMQAMMEKIKAANSIPKPKPTTGYTSDFNLPLYDKEGNPISLDADQSHAVDKAESGHSFCMIGNAGTGKTTTNQAISLIWRDTHSHIYKDIKYRIKGAGEYAEGKSIAIVSWTNQATDNMRKALLTNKDLQEFYGDAYNITTIHNLLEYSKDYVETWDDELGQTVTKMRYFPTKDADNKLDITHLVLEEGSLVAVGNGGLWNQLEAALPDECQIIILGDISQLPPVGGKSILSYALLALPVVELKTIHRQALESPIIRQAYNVLKGKPISTDLLPNGEGVEVLHGNAKFKTGIDRFKEALAKTLPSFIESKRFILGDSVILSPYNKLGHEHVGAMHLSNIIGTYLAHKAGRKVYEIKAGISTLYLSEGDHVLYQKQKAIVTKIERNDNYTGSMPKPASTTLDYWGKDTSPLVEAHDELFAHLDSIDLADIRDIDYSNLDVTEDKKLTERAASHRVYIQYGSELSDSPVPDIPLDKAGQLGADNFYLAYALTVHKAQGSEWDNVIVVVHDSNSSMLFREMLYTAMTRPKKLLIVLGQEHTINKMIKNPRIKGNSLQDKVAFFNGTGYLDQKVNIPEGYTDI